MKSRLISIDLPDDILLALNESENELKERIKLSLAIRLYQDEKLTIGKAAQLSGKTRLDFENELVKNSISISNLTEDDIMADIEKIRN